MRKDFYLTGFFLVTAVVAFAFQPPSVDSSGVVPQKKKNTPTVTTRVHTMGLFLYMGKVVNHNPAADLFFNYTTRNGWGFSAFKVVDVNDLHSHNNFAFMFVSKAFHLGQRLTIAPFLGAGLEQQHSFANRGSDAMAQLMSTYKLNKKLSVEYIGIFNNIIFATEHADWTNRFRLMYTDRHWDLIGLFWNNNGFIDHATYTSAGGSLYYNRIPVADKLWIGVGLTTLVTIQSSNERSIPKQSGLQFTTALTFK
jgi:hypothetical protein